MGRVDVNATQYHQGLQLQEDQGRPNPPPPQSPPPPPPPAAANQYFPPPPPPAAAEQPYPPQPSPHYAPPGPNNNNNNPWSAVLPATATHHQDPKESPRSSSSSEEDNGNMPPHTFLPPPPPPPAQQHEYPQYYNSADADDEKPQMFPPPQHGFQEETPQAFPPPQQQPSGTAHQFVHHQFPPPPQQQQQQQQIPFNNNNNQQQQNGFVAGIPMPHQPQQSFLQQPHIQNINQPASPFMQPLPQFNPWSSSLFDCMNDPQNAIITACFPCVTFGQIAEIVDAGSTSCSSGGMMYACIAILIAMPCLMSCGYRTKIRSKFGLAESPAPDWFVHCFCEWCALCQEYRELQARGLDPSIGWAGNVAKQMHQQQQQVHMTPPMQQRMM